MEMLSIFKAVNYIANLPGDASIRVYYDFATGMFKIYEDLDLIEKDEEGSFCAGSPDKFFAALQSAIYQSVVNK